MSKRAQRKRKKALTAAKAALAEPPPIIPKKWNPHARAELDVKGEEYYGNRLKYSLQQSNERNAKLNAKICVAIGRTCNFDFAYLGTTIKNPLGDHLPPIPNTVAPLPYAPLSLYNPKDQVYEQRRRQNFLKALQSVRACIRS
jgi:hypothetical protein